MANLTSKELSALEDQLSQEQVLVRKYRAMSGICANSQVKQCLNDYADRHQQHLSTLVTFLQ